MNESTARNEICRVGRSLFERGYVHATAGNISVRLSDGFLITPTDACLGTLQPDEIAKVDLSGRQVGGPKASKTLKLHERIYRANEDLATPTGCVIHTHSTYCVAASFAADAREYLLPPITPYFVMKVGRVPLVPYHRPGDPAVADAVAALIAQHARQHSPIRAVMLSRLGPNVWHDTPAQAMAVLEELEETAKLWFLARPDALPQSAIEELRTAFGASW
jgi:ribulose-5-phosphate 4-epimerase/fuculose-1-phosphate aldolase